MWFDSLRTRCPEEYQLLQAEWDGEFYQHQEMDVET
jgi:hypothetical protein